MHEDVAEQWRLLHGYTPSAPASQLSVDPHGELAGYRGADFLAGPNVVETALDSSAHRHRLDLWEAFVSVLPSQSLGNGDVLFTYVPPPIYPAESAAVVLWNHERDHFYAASPDDLREVGHPGPVGDASKALMFGTRCAYLVELLSRGRFDLDAYLAHNHLPMALDQPAFYDNVRASPPTATYALWQLFFTGQSGIERLMEAGEQSPARWTRDTARLISELLAGRNQLGPIDDVRAVREEITAITADPKTLAAAAGAQRRGQVEQQVARVRPAVLVRDDTEGEPATGVTSATIGDLELQVVEGMHQRFRLVLRRDGRALDARALAGIGGAADYQTSFHVVQAGPVPLVMVWRPADPASPRQPWDGAATVYAVVSNRLVLLASYEIDVQRIETVDGRIVVRTASGAGYRCMPIDATRIPTQPATTLPGSPGAPPAESPPHELDGDRLELTPTSLKLWRGKRVLFEEPLTEAYAMTVLPARRMVAVHGTDANLEPTVDVLYVKKVTRAVKPGNGCCSWVCFPVKSLDVKLASSSDQLFVHDGAEWIEIADEPLTTVPAWIRNRGWVK